MSSPRLLAAAAAVVRVVSVVALVLGGLVWVGTAAQATSHPTRHRQWAPAATATIHPGTQMVTGGEQCTANFVFTDSTGHVYVGYAAHCSGTGGQSDTDGCTTGSVPLNTKVRFANAMSPTSGGTTAGYGRLVYSSWITMRRLHTKDSEACAYNDFALVRVDPGSVAHVNPSMPTWGGPTGLASSRPARTARVYTWGQSGLRPAAGALSAKRGVSLGSDNAWSSTAYTATPGIPGDSGSGFLDASGRAYGVLATITVTPLAASNGIGSLPRELTFAQAHSGIKGLALSAGTAAFHG